MVISRRHLTLFRYLFFCWILFPADALSASLDPLQLRDARLLPMDAAEVRFGLDYAHDDRQLFQPTDSRRRLAQLPTVALRLGLGERVESQLSYSLLLLRQDGQRTTYGSGDLTFGFKVRLDKGSDRRPALALYTATKLPNADDDKNLGTDQTDIFFDLLASRPLARATLFLNLGLAILGDSSRPANRQDDLLRYGIGMALPAGRGTILVAAEGMDLGRSTAHNRRGVLRAGVQFLLGDWRFDVGGRVGYVRESEDWGVGAGLTLPLNMRSWRRTRWEPRR